MHPKIKYSTIISILWWDQTPPFFRAMSQDILIFWRDLLPGNSTEVAQQRQQSSSPRWAVGRHGRNTSAYACNTHYRMSSMKLKSRKWSAWSVYNQAIVGRKQFNSPYEDYPWCSRSIYGWQIFIHPIVLPKEQSFQQKKNRNLPSMEWNGNLQLRKYLLRLLRPLMFGGHHKEVNAPLLNRIPWLVPTNRGHGEVGFIWDSAFTTGIWGLINRSRVCIIPEEEAIGSS